MNPRSLVPLAIRLSDKTVQQGECILWTGRKTNEGYGTISVRGRMELTHRVAFELAYGRIRKTRNLRRQLCVLHKCDTPLCVNPRHLFLGTRTVNNRDTAAKGRARNHNSGKMICKRGHPLTPDNVYISRRPGYRTSRVCRQCRACSRLKSAAYVLSAATKEKKRIADANRWRRTREQAEQGKSQQLAS